MAVKYKRKFKVPGETIKDCWDFRKKCEKKYGSYYERPCYTKTSNYRGWKKDENRCPYPIGKPNEYIVSEMEDGTWRCSCPVWKFRRQQCHHIDKAQRNPEKYEIAVEYTERLTNVWDKVFET